MTMVYQMMPCPGAANDRQDYFIEAIANTTSVRIGDPFQVILTAGARQGLVTLPAKHVMIEGCQLIDYQERDVGRFHQGYLAKQGIYQLTAFVTDKLLIPPLAVQIEWANNKNESIYSRPFAMEIKSEHPKPGFQLLDPRGPHPLPFPWFLASVIATGLSLSLWLLFKFQPQGRRKKGADLPAHIRAFSQLNHLGASEIVRQGDVQEYFIVLSKVVRTYLAKRYHFPALEISRLAIIDMLEKRGVEAKRRKMIDALLEECDRIKFSREKVLHNKMAVAHGQAREIIELTKEEKGQ